MKHDQAMRRAADEAPTTSRGETSGSARDDATEDDIQILPSSPLKKKAKGTDKDKAGSQDTAVKYVCIHAGWDTSKTDGFQIPIGVDRLRNDRFI